MVDARTVGIGLALLAFGGLLFLAHTMRRPDSQEGQPERYPHVDRYLRRRDLMNGRRPENLFEWVIAFSHVPKAQIALVVAVGGVSLLFAGVGYRAAAWVGGFFTLLALLVMLLFFGWEWLERFYSPAGGAETQGATPLHFDSLPDRVAARLRMQGVKPAPAGSGQPERGQNMTDLKVALTLGTIIVVVLGLFNLVIMALG